MAMEAIFPLDDVGWTSSRSPTGNDEGAPPLATPVLICVGRVGFEPTT